MFWDDETTLCDEKQRSRLKTPSKASPTAEKIGERGIGGAMTVGGDLKWKRSRKCDASLLFVCLSRSTITFRRPGLFGWGL